jgi:hypothetical protein
MAEEKWLEDLRQELADPHEEARKHAAERVFQAHREGNIIHLGVPASPIERGHIMWAVIESFGSEHLLEQMNERLLKSKGTVSLAKDYTSGLDEIFPYAELSWLDRNEIWSDNYIRIEAVAQGPGFALTVNGTEVEPADAAVKDALKDAFRSPQRRRRDEHWEW